MRKIIYKTITAVTVSLIVLIWVSNAISQERSIAIVGRNEITVTTPKVKLGDIADVSGKAVTEDEAVIGLKKIELVNSPAPNEVITLSAFDILQKLNDQGVNTNNLKYTFPRITSIRRASRTIESQEIQTVINNYVATSGLQTEVSAIEYSTPIYVAAGEISLSVESSAASGMGKRAFNLLINTSDGSTKRASLIARVKEFKEVPVSKRNLPKGSIISEGDFVMARLNLDSIPTDAIDSIDGVIGYEASKDITNGEVLRFQKVTPPILVHSGSAVLMKYEGALFEATATGVALESGGAGQEIKVKNDSSKKIVIGKINQAGIVVVK
jgi:flagella basal body P-ring formation protein FlgA